MSDASETAGMRLYLWCPIQALTGSAEVAFTAVGLVEGPPTAPVAVLENRGFPLPKVGILPHSSELPTDQVWRPSSGRAWAACLLCFRLVQVLGERGSRCANGAASRRCSSAGTGFSPKDISQRSARRKISSGRPVMLFPSSDSSWRLSRRASSGGTSESELSASFRTSRLIMRDRDLTGTVPSLFSLRHSRRRFFKGISPSGRSSISLLLRLSFSRAGIFSKSSGTLVSLLLKA
mmetsp:Transcript_8318/g.23860  ORF Transcript_8318/g.23860 Transcript_8318/m.23860 type:complete len:235 (-) Transcript_8318:174-878(-)